VSDHIWLNGNLTRTDSAIHATDRGWTLGDGLFETMLWTGTCIRLFDRHMARFQDACAGLDLPAPPSPPALLDAITMLLEAARIKHKTAAVRLTYSRGTSARGLALPPLPNAPTCMISAAPFRPDTSPALLKLVSIIRAAGNPSARYKTLSYGDQVMALAQAQADGGSDAVLLGRDNRVACASASNVIVVGQDGRLTTPAVDDGALPGTVRGFLIDEGLIDEGPITIADLEAATAMATCNALHGVRPVVSFARAIGPAGYRSTAYPPVSMALDGLREALSLLGPLNHE
jgi:branched-chain amino acid aminotransferase